MVTRKNRFLGERELDDTQYYGVQTRGENFHITGVPVSNEPYLIAAFGYVKKPRQWRTTGGRFAERYLSGDFKGV